MIKNKMLIITAALLTAGTVGSTVYASNDVKVEPDGRYSVGDLIKENEFSNDISYPWSVVTLRQEELADFNTDGEKLNIIINNGSQDRWDIQVRHRGLALELGHTYNVQFEVTATEDCKVYAKIGDKGDPYNEYWNNYWEPFDVKKGETLKVNQKFTYNYNYDASNCEMAFHLSGDCQGKTFPYTVSFDNIHVYDKQFPGYVIDKEETSNIKVNQLGYSSDGEKIAIADIDSMSSMNWNLIDNKVNLVKSGRTTPSEYDLISGTCGHIIDFSDYKISGDGYKLEIEKPDDSIESIKYSKYESVSFDIGDIKDKYNNLRKDSLKYFTANRDDSNKHEAYKDLMEISNKWYTSRDSYDVKGGWNNNTNRSKNVPEGSFALWMLQNKYEHAIKNNKVINGVEYIEDNLNIPESDNNYPDILDEGRFELEYLLKMQIPDGTNKFEGMVHHNIEKRSSVLGIEPAVDHPDRDIMPPSTAATLDFAAVAAQGSRVWKDYDSEFAAKCVKAAEKAWNAAVKNPDIKVTDNGSLKDMHYSDSELDDEFYFAACELYSATGKSEYLDYIKSSKCYLSMPQTVTDSTGKSVIGNFNQ